MLMADRYGTVKGDCTSSMATQAWTMAPGAGSPEEEEEEEETAFTAEDAESAVIEKKKRQCYSAKYFATKHESLVGNQFGPP